MNWIVRTLLSSIGKKLLMALTGLFLITFLIVHMAGNFALLIPDIKSAAESFNVYAVFMTTFPLIKITSYLLYGSILLHALYALVLTISNKKARPQGYAVTTQPKGVSWASTNMGILGTIVFVFIILHMGNFWFRYHFGNALPVMEIDGQVYKNLYAVVATSFVTWWYSAFYIIAMVAVGFHIWHGFQSGFQTLGLRHVKYTPLISFISKGLAVVFVIGFSSMPLYMMARFGTASSFEEAEPIVRKKMEIEEKIEWKTSDWSKWKKGQKWADLATENQ